MAISLTDTSLVHALSSMECRWFPSLPFPIALANTIAIIAKANQHHRHRTRHPYPPHLIHYVKVSRLVPLARSPVYFSFVRPWCTPIKRYDLYSVGPPLSRKMLAINPSINHKPLRFKNSLPF